MDSNEAIPHIDEKPHIDDVDEKPPIPKRSSLKIPTNGSKISHGDNEADSEPEKTSISDSGFSKAPKLDVTAISDLKSVPSFQIDSSLVGSSGDLEMATPGPSNKEDRNLMPVRRKRRPRTPKSDTKTPKKIPIDWSKELSLCRANAGDSKLITTVLPNIDSLKEAHRKNYRERLLDKMFDYSEFIDDPLSQEMNGKVQVSLRDSRNRSLILEILRLSDEPMHIIKNFITGVKLLKMGSKYEESAKGLIQEAACEKLPYAMYVSAIITFKKLVRCRYLSKDTDGRKSKLPPKKELEQAVRYMLEVKQRFFPLPNFVLGIIQLYNINPISKLIENELFSSEWYVYLVEILRAIDDVEGRETSRCWADFSKSYGYYKVAKKNVSDMKYIDVLEDRDGHNLKWMVHCIKYEIANEVILERKNHTLAESLLKELSSDGFIDAKYSYAISLLTNEFDVKFFKKQNFNEALDLLVQAVEDKHKEAMLLFGTLPFRKEFDVIEKGIKDLMGLKCFYCLEEYMRGRDKDFRKESAVLVAAEYLKSDGYVTYNEKNAKNILETYGCSDELQELERNLQIRQEKARDALPEVIEALMEIIGNLEKNGGIYAARLVPILRPLFDELRSRCLTVRKSQRLSLLLQLLRITPTEPAFLLAAELQQLCILLQPQAGSQSRSLQQKVYSLLSNLFKTCLAMSMEQSTLGDSSITI